MLLFIDNIFRFTQAGSEVSALLGRMPSAVGYQPTLATEMGELQERITSTKTRLDHLGAGRLRAGRRLHRPGAGDDLRPPRRDHRRWSASIAERGIYPAVDPLASTSRILDPHIVGEEHYQRRPRGAAVLQRYKRPAGHHRHPRHRGAVRGGQADRRPRAPDRALLLAAVLHGRAVHRYAGPVRDARGDASAASRRSSTASTTTCPSRPSCTWAASTKSCRAAQGR